MADEPSYGPRYCAFVDILGLSELINSLEKGSTTFVRLKGLLRQIQHPFRGPEDSVFKNTGFRAQSISDAVALSTDLNDSGLHHLFYVLEQLAIGLWSMAISSEGRS